MKKLLSEKTIISCLFIVALCFFYVANEDAKQLGVLQTSVSVAPDHLSQLHPPATASAAEIADNLPE